MQCAPWLVGSRLPQSRSLPFTDRLLILRCCRRWLPLPPVIPATKRRTPTHEARREAPSRSREFVVGTRPWPGRETNGGELFVDSDYSISRTPPKREFVVSLHMATGKDTTRPRGFPLCELVPRRRAPRGPRAAACGAQHGVQDATCRRQRRAPALGL